METYFLAQKLRHFLLTNHAEFTDHRILIFTLMTLMLTGLDDLDLLRGVCYCCFRVMCFTPRSHSSSSNFLSINASVIFVNSFFLWKIVRSWKFILFYPLSIATFRLNNISTWVTIFQELIPHLVQFSVFCLVMKYWQEALAHIFYIWSF